jgi:pyrophosphatase PpaX
MTTKHRFAQTQAILFDLDGTLIDTTDLILRCFDHTWQSVCGIRHSREALLMTFGIPLREAMRKLLAEAGSSLPADETSPTETSRQNELVESLLDTYRAFNFANHDSIARPFASTQQVISTLCGRGYAIGVVTSKGRDLALRGLKLCAIDTFVRQAVYLEDTTIHKPRPEPILAALEKLQIQPGQAVYVGDSFHDMAAGRAAGVKTIAAAWGPMPRAELEREQPDFIADSMDDLLDIFD